jgi:DNA-binding response OmpR family regulator
MSGVDFDRQLRASGVFAKTPVIMASGRDVEREALEAGANRFLTKPFDPGKLPDHFSELIG